MLSSLVNMKYNAMPTLAKPIPPFCRGLVPSRMCYAAAAAPPISKVIDPHITKHSRSASLVLSRLSALPPARSTGPQGVPDPDACLDRALLCGRQGSLFKSKPKFLVTALIRVNVPKLPSSSICLVYIPKRIEVCNPCPGQERVSDAPIHRSWTAKVNARVRAASIAPDSRGRELPPRPSLDFIPHPHPLSLSR